jgi:4-diphosphocytidyl-2-C-methyl-D-erythritol kinase
MDSLALSSPAKVNLYLKVLGRRPDGFHELETVMAALSLADEMRFDLKPTGLSLECDEPGVPTDDTNLALRAARALQQKRGVNKGAHIVIRKRTPVGGGMGGGSSNAATALLALNQLWQLDASLAELQAIAATLGSDVPFFLQPGVALCRGRGEIIEPLGKDRCGSLRDAAVVLLNPGFGVSTPWAYRSYAKGGGAEAEPKRSISPLLNVLARGDVPGVASQLYNSLEATVFHKYPILGIFKQSLIEAGAIGALMSGSGATVFGLCENEESAEQVRTRITEKFGVRLWVHVARFAVRS